VMVASALDSLSLRSSYVSAAADLTVAATAGVEKADVWPARLVSGSCLSSFGSGCCVDGASSRMVVSSPGEE
jgi:hypothetical protein